MMRRYYKVKHIFFSKRANHFRFFSIGIYDAKQKALTR